MHVEKHGVVEPLAVKLVSGAASWIQTHFAHGERSAFQIFIASSQLDKSITTRTINHEAKFGSSLGAVAWWPPRASVSHIYTGLEFRCSDPYPCALTSTRPQLTQHTDAHTQLS